MPYYRRGIKIKKKIVAIVFGVMSLLEEIYETSHYNRAFSILISLIATCIHCCRNQRLCHPNTSFNAIVSSRSNYWKFTTNYWHLWIVNHKFQVPESQVGAIICRLFGQVHYFLLTQEFLIPWVHVPVVEFAIYKPLIAATLLFNYVHKWLLYCKNRPELWIP